MACDVASGSRCSWLESLKRHVVLQLMLPLAAVSLRLGACHPCCSPNKDAEVASPPSDGISSLRFSPGSNLLVATSWSGQVRLGHGRVKTWAGCGRPWRCAAVLFACTAGRSPTIHARLHVQHTMLPSSRSQQCRCCAGMCRAMGRPSPRRPSPLTSRCCAAPGAQTAAWCLQVRRGPAGRARASRRGAVVDRSRLLTGCGR